MAPISASKQYSAGLFFYRRNRAMAGQKSPDFSQIPNTAIKVITNPVGFYRDMPKSGGFLEPLVFAVAMALVAALVGIVLSFMGLGATGMMAAGMIAIIVVPIAVVIGSFIGAGILYLIWMIMGSKESYETAFRCIAYMTAISPITALVGAMPYLGTIISVVWGTFLLVTASIEVHKVKAQTVYIVFGILGLLVLAYNLKSEYMLRSFQSTIGNIGQMTPEEAGKAAAEFMRGLDQNQGNQGR
ncbi:MAG TPA: hypothetical protein ENI80_03980 [Acidiferrobacteraceae bacterium]|nr:hypothetical protein [Acidiferrobacteraceae bacterium]